MPLPFWIPALWIGATLALVPHQPWVTLLGYHALCLFGAKGTPLRWGRVPRLAWLPLAGAALAALWILRLPPQAHGLPTAGAQAFLAYWPGGLPSYAAYTLTVNSLCEEWFWRGAMPLSHPRWQDGQQGAAFGLHHFVANGLVFGWALAPAAFLYTALMGLLGVKVARRCGGVGLTMLAHTMLNAISFAWLATRL